jgi:hypothetical protein
MLNNRLATTRQSCEARALCFCCGFVWLLSQNLAYLISLS